ncbi:hypothetical protein J7M23_08525 [Candidatus Sumerlaeota bacterium]|nr:hypothetical protein [Candidatus Sumerlaeota bacterium]
MKAIFLVHNVGISDELEELLKKVGIENFTRWERVQGVGQSSGPHLGTHIWPSINSALFVVADDEKAKVLLEGVRQLRTDPLFSKEGIKAFCWDITEIT